MMDVTGQQVTEKRPTSERCALQLVPHEDAHQLAERITITSRCNPRLRIDNVRQQKPIKAIIKHCKSRWEQALGEHASSLLLRAPKDKGGFIVEMSWKVSELIARLQPLPCNNDGMLLRLEYLLESTAAEKLAACIAAEEQAHGARALLEETPPQLAGTQRGADFLPDATTSAAAAPSAVAAPSVATDSSAAAAPSAAVPPSFIAAPSAATAVPATATTSAAGDSGGLGGSGCSGDLGSETAGVAGATVATSSAKRMRIHDGFIPTRRVELPRVPPVMWSCAHARPPRSPPFLHPRSSFSRAVSVAGAA
jgi:hypothetical protein